MSYSDSISLHGDWNYALDPIDVGMEQGWFARALEGTVPLPGCLSENGIGDPVSPATNWIGQVIDKSWFTEPEFEEYRQEGNVKVPFWLQPEVYYRGAAWYQRTIVIPEAWQGQRVFVYLERCHWQSTVWVDDIQIGESLSLSTPHEYELPALTPGEHRLTLRIDNDLIVDVGVDSHCVSEHTQGNWNGVIGRLELRVRPKAFVSDIQVYPNVRDRSIRYVGEVNGGGYAGEGTVMIELGANRICQPVQWTAEDTQFEGRIELGADYELWDEFSPVTYSLSAKLGDGPTFSTSFGFREISTEGTRFLINGRKTYFRGTLECCIFPLTGYPPTDVEEWRRIYRVAKAHGLNLIRFHSYCPPRAAFVAADEVGIYLQVETCWANASTKVGEGYPVDEWIYQETDRVLREYGNHPSFILMPYGNEPGGPKQEEFLGAYVTHYRATDARRLWTSGAGWPEIAESEFHITPSPRIHQWGDELKSRINSSPPATVADYRDFVSSRAVPFISHEIGQWCVYPNFAEMAKYRGYLKPRNFEIFNESLERQGMGDQAHDFLVASGKLQALCYKEEIESALRTPGMGGFQLLDLHDFPGQGTALVGVLDPFWEEKGYITADEYRRFCGPIVPLVRLPKRVFVAGEKLEATVEVAQFGAETMREARVSWKVVAGNAVLAEGAWTVDEIPVELVELGALSTYLDGVDAATAAKLFVSVNEHENDWDLWIYPAELTVPEPAFRTVREWSADAETALASGESVLLMPGKGRFANDERRPVKLGFSSIFWNTAWTSRQAPTTLGVLCDPSHPLFADFPTEFHTNWQWWYPLQHADPILMDKLPTEVRPIIQIVDDWTTNHRLGLLFEAKVGPGRLMVSGIDLSAAEDPVCRRLWASLVTYLASASFDPTSGLEAQDLAIS